MRKVIASGAIIVYMISVVTFCLLLPKEGEKATATDFGVMCINAVYPSASIGRRTSEIRENAEKRDNSVSREGAKRRSGRRRRRNRSGDFRRR